MEKLPQIANSTSVIAGSVLAYYGIKRKSALGAGMALAGGELLRRGISGFRGNRTHWGVRVDRSVTINKPREEVYAFWRNLENLPQFMKHLKSVKVCSPTRSHWTALGPGGRPMEWDAEVINEVEGELIGWRSLPGSRVENAGSVHFRDAAGDRGTEIRVALQYKPPAGALGSAFAKLFGDSPEEHIAEDLRRLKALLEAGQVANSAKPKSLKRQAAEQERIHRASEESFPASDAPSYR